MRVGSNGYRWQYLEPLVGRVFTCLVLLAGLALGARPVYAQAASLTFTPASGSYGVGQTFSVSVYVASPDQAMNAVSGRVSFPPDELQATALSKSGSIVSLWVQEPSLDNAVGQVRFEGIVLNPGFKGTGKVVSITFKVKAVGEARLGFASASVLANDGQGTNMLEGVGSAQYSLGGSSSAAPESSSPVVVAGVPAAPQVSSSTHPDPNKWYANSNPTFSWVNPPGTDGVNVLADHNPTSDPGLRSDGLRTSYTYENVDDGVWYFHIRLHNAKGWGAISHFRFQIDTQKPDAFSIKFVDSVPTTNPTPTALFNTTDLPSGIDHYNVKVGDQEFARLAAAVVVSSNPYVLPPEAPGKHTMLVQAVDAAGNYVTASQDFEVLPISQPVLLNAPTELDPSEPFVVRGRTYPAAQVRLTLVAESDPPAYQDVSSDGLGDFTVTWPRRLSAGTYQYTLQVTDNRGAKSLPTEPQVLLVRERPLLHFGKLAISYLTMFVTLACLLLGLMVVAVYGYVKLRRLRRTVQQEVTTAERLLHRSFRTLQDNLKRQLRLLERTRTKRELTVEEEKISLQLQKALAAAEQAVAGELEDIRHTTG